MRQLDLKGKNMKQENLGELIGLLVGGLGIVEMLGNNSAARRVASIITHSDEADLIDELGRRYQQAVGFVMHEFKYTPQMMWDIAEPSLRRIFERNIKVDPELVSMSPEQQAERWAKSKEVVIKGLELVHEQMGQSWYDIKPTEEAKQCREGFTQFEAGFNSQNPSIPDDTALEVEFDDGYLTTGVAGSFCWAKHHNHPVIIGFRVIEHAH
jgi:hypothetical protein